MKRASKHLSVVSNLALALVMVGFFVAWRSLSTLNEVEFVSGLSAKEYTSYMDDHQGLRESIMKDADLPSGMTVQQHGAKWVLVKR